MKTLIAQTGLVIAVLLLFVSCRQRSFENDPPAAEAETGSFIVRGVIREIRPDGRTALVQHEEIPGFMAAMTMPIEAKHPRELEGFKAGDPITFRLVVTEDDAWMDAIVKLEASPFEEPLQPPIHRVRQIDDLNVGDILPDYRFTNELGRQVSLADYRGKVLAITFIFTSCPMPTICPRMSRNFAETQQRLMSDANGPAEWHLLSISIDPEVDSPARLRAYALSHGYNPERWSFLTGDLEITRAFSEALDLYFWREDNTINHNLQTVVVNPEGRIRKIFPGNEWTPDELIDELVEAAR
jgi:protein SCO1